MLHSMLHSCIRARVPKSVCAKLRDCAHGTLCRGSSRSCVASVSYQTQMPRSEGQFRAGKVVQGKNDERSTRRVAL